MGITGLYDAFDDFVKENLDIGLTNDEGETNFLGHILQVPIFIASLSVLAFAYQTVILLLLSKEILKGVIDLPFTLLGLDFEIPDELSQKLGIEGPIKNIDDLCKLIPPTQLILFIPVFKALENSFTNSEEKEDNEHEVLFYKLDIPLKTKDGNILLARIKRHRNNSEKRGSIFRLDNFGQYRGQPMYPMIGVYEEGKEVEKDISLEVRKKAMVNLYAEFERVGQEFPFKGRHLRTMKFFYDNPNAKIEDLMKEYRLKQHTAKEYTKEIKHIGEFIFHPKTFSGAKAVAPHWHDQGFDFDLPKE